MNPPPLRSPIAHFFVGLWDLMNFTRRLIFNLVFFGGLLLLAVLFLAGYQVQRSLVFGRRPAPRQPSSCSASPGPCGGLGDTASASPASSPTVHGA